MEAKPNSTQLEAIGVLENDYKTQKESFEKAIVKNLPKNPELKNPKAFK